MDDFVAYVIPAQYLRELTIFMNVVAAFFIGPYLAFASTPDAGFRCFQAFIRMVHRCVLVIFAVALMNNAVVLTSETSPTPTGSAFALSICIFVSVVISALRYRFWMSDIPADASWRHPHFPHRKTAVEAAAETVRRRAG